ncbi:MAG: hydroxyphenylacetyl-CoA thioesterase PaaI [Defluviicoccus sp.]
MADDAETGQFLAEHVIAWMARYDRVGRGFGVRVVTVAPYAVSLALTVRADMLNAHGVCHGGVIFSLADSAFAYACNSQNDSALATAGSIHFLSAAREGEELIATARQAAQQKRIGLYDVTVATTDGRTVALFRGSSYRLQAVLAPPPPASPGADAAADS